jgi:hypothetical protein
MRDGKTYLVFREKDAVAGRMGRRVTPPMGSGRLRPLKPRDSAADVGRACSPSGRAEARPTFSARLRRALPSS